jgi:hypothetical protein
MKEIRLICPRCKERWAPYLEGDFKKVVRVSAIGEEVEVMEAASQAAQDRRDGMIWCDEEAVCDECRLGVMKGG